MYIKLNSINEFFKYKSSKTKKIYIFKSVNKYNSGQTPILINVKYVSTMCCYLS